MKSFLLAAALLATPALADPLKDTPRSTADYSCGAGQTAQECLNDFIESKASDQAYREVAIKVCPGVYVADPKLRELRNKKYRGHPEFKTVYKAQSMLAARFPDTEGTKMFCRNATSPDEPDAYGKNW